MWLNGLHFIDSLRAAPPLLVAASACSSLNANKYTAPAASAGNRAPNKYRGRHSCSAHSCKRRGNARPTKTRRVRRFMSRVRQRSPRNSVDGDDDMSLRSASPAPLLPSSTKDVTPSKEGFVTQGAYWLAWVQNAALNVTADGRGLKLCTRSARRVPRVARRRRVSIELMKTVLALAPSRRNQGQPNLLMMAVVTHPLDCLK